MKVLYNGSTGSLGQYFKASLVKLGIKGQALHSRLEDHLALARELEFTREAVLPKTPVFLVHMAALVSVKACEEDPSQAFKTNVTDTVETFRTFARWTRQLSATPVVVHVSTGHVYKAPSERKPVTEDHEVAPRSVYARTKLEAETQLKALADQLGVSLLIGRVFGLIAPRQPSHYVLPGLIHRVQTGALAATPGLEYYRDYLDSRDVCDALARFCILAVSETIPFRVVNICSGRAVSIRSLVEEIILAMHPNGKQELLSRLSAGPGRPDDIQWLVGSCARFEALTGTKLQQISLTQTIRDALSEGLPSS
ncbi:MAG TPA: NAD(P)-dependent oxidoreductase [Terriglobia bacterium]|nr:NAD(P)-dependent oxidoreductase [Terriglobia bacterium]